MTFIIVKSSNSFLSNCIIFLFLTNSKLFNLNNKYKTEEHTIPDNLRSKELEWKLALLVRNVDSVEDIDMQFVKKTKINKGTKQDLYTSYRLDFDIREKLNQFKKKYRDILL